MDDTKQDDPVRIARQEVLDRHELDAIDIRIIGAMVDFPSITEKEIGALLGLSRSAVAARKGKEKFKKRWAEINAAPIDKIKKQLGRLTDEYIKLATGGDQPVRERALRTLLTTHGIVRPGGEDSMEAGGSSVSIKMLNGSVEEITFSKKPNAQTDETNE